MSKCSVAKKGDFWASSFRWLSTRSHRQTDNSIISKMITNFRLVGIDENTWNFRFFGITALRTVSVLSRLFSEWGSAFGIDTTYMGALMLKAGVLIRLAAWFVRWSSLHSILAGFHSALANNWCNNCSQDKLYIITALTMTFGSWTGSAIRPSSVGMQRIIACMHTLNTRLARWVWLSSVRMWVWLGNVLACAYLVRGRFWCFLLCRVWLCLLHHPSINKVLTFGFIIWCNIILLWLYVYLWVGLHMSQGISDHSAHTCSDLFHASNSSVVTSAS